MAYNLVVNSMHSTAVDPIRCHGDGCNSYLLTGGLLMTTPWTPEAFPTYPLVKIQSVPAVQLEFKNSPESIFASNDCLIYGSENILIGIRMCLKANNTEPSSLTAGEE
jgi:hypothetical protein